MKTYEQFIVKNSQEPINEGIFDMFKKMFKKIGETIRKTKGGQEIEKIVAQYNELINAALIKQVGVNLNLNVSSIKETRIFRYHDFLNEAEMTEEQATKNLAQADTALENEPVNPNKPIDPNKPIEQTAPTEKTDDNTKLTLNTLKTKALIIDKIIETYKAQALKKMNQVLTKYGGADKNPRLAVIISNKMDEFNLNFLEKKLQFLEKAGDKNQIVKVKSDRDKLSKELQQKWSKLDEAGNPNEKGELVIGLYYRYNTPDGIKTIKIIKQSPTQGKIIATYVLEKDGELKEQEFDINNINTEFDPKPTEQYNYYSETNKDIIVVTIKSYDENKKELLVTSQSGNDFKARMGAIRDKIETKPAAQTPKVQAQKSAAQTTKA